MDRVKHKTRSTWGRRGQRSPRMPVHHSPSNAPVHEGLTTDSGHEPTPTCPTRPAPSHRRRRSSIVSNPPGDAEWSPVSLYSRPPPSSFYFPFQTYPGNPDPLPHTSRRSSTEDISIDPSASYNSLLLRETRSTADIPHLGRPHAPFMRPGSGLLYRNSIPGAIVSSTASDIGPRNPSQIFRAPFLSPASRPSSSLWSPPSNTYAYIGGSITLGHTPPQMAPSAASSALALALPKAKPPQPSTRLPEKLAQSDKPWLAKIENRALASWWITFFCFCLGVGAAVVLCWVGIEGVHKLDDSQLCLVLEDQFDNLDTENTWTRDVEMGGFGNGEFQMTTALDNNSYIQNSNLYIMPTLTSDVIGTIPVLNGGSYNLSQCTSVVTNTTRNTCSARSNGINVIPPVMSARLSTKGRYSIRYGKVEVRAKLPRGDWLWPAIWMLSENDTYGVWPLSGEIDIMEARGNDQSYAAQGVNYVRSSLNYGPLPSLTHTIFGWLSTKRIAQGFAAGFHVYAFEWTAQFMRFYVDNRLRTTLILDTRGGKEGFWKRGAFPDTAVNGSAGNGMTVGVADPWGNGGVNAPFDQAFYLILDLAVGGTSGWFPDNVGGKPWSDASQTAMLEFAEEQSTWYATWPETPDDRAFRVDYVKMWKLC